VINQTWSPMFGTWPIWEPYFIAWPRTPFIPWFNFFLKTLLFWIVCSACIPPAGKTANHYEMFLEVFWSISNYIGLPRWNAVLILVLGTLLRVSCNHSTWPNPCKEIHLRHNGKTFPAVVWLLTLLRSIGFLFQQSSRRAHLSHTSHSKGTDEAQGVAWRKSGLWVWCPLERGVHIVWITLRSLSHGISAWFSDDSSWCSHLFCLP